MTLWKAELAVRIPKGKVSHSYRPRWVTKAVLYASDGSIPNCQNPAVQSRVVMYLAGHIRASKSSANGMGYASLIIKDLTYLRSVQIRMSPLAFLIHTIGWAKQLVDFLILPSSNSWSIWRSTSTLKASGIR